MATVAIKRGTSAVITATSVVDGQLLFTTDLGIDNKVYLDVGTIRVQVSGRSSASEISYNHTTSGLTATTVQGAVDEIDSIIDAKIICGKTSAANIASGGEYVFTITFTPDVSNYVPVVSMVCTYGYGGYVIGHIKSQSAHSIEVTVKNTASVSLPVSVNYVLTQ